MSNNFYPGDPKATWRGVTVCTDMVPALDALAKATGKGIYCRPIPGFGSYQSGRTASGTIAIRGGHIDFDLESVPESLWDDFETTARKMGWLAVRRYRRWYSTSRGRWLTGDWQNHLHCTRFGDPHLSPLAISQQNAMLSGMNGLANDPDPDKGYRGAEFGQTFADYLKRITGTVTSVGLSVVVAGVQKAAGVGADGSWGPQTEGALEKVRKAGGPKAAVQAVQKALGQTADGVWGPKTEAAYQKVRSQTYGPAKPPKTTAQKVRDIQAALRVTVDGNLGNQTYWAVWRLSAVSRDGKKGWDGLSASSRKNLQANVGVKDDGVWGPKTAAAIPAAVGGVQQALGINIDRVWTDNDEGAVFGALVKQVGYKP